MARNNAPKIELTAYDDLFQTDESRAEAKLSKIRDIPISQIDEFPDHPFKVLMDEDMQQLVESIKRNGIMTPATVRLKEDGRYELVSGHRRKKACELAGLETLKCEVKELTRDEAIIVMVESNLQRSTILPSEKAFAYKMRLEAMDRQGQRNDLTSTPMVSKSRSNEELADKVGESREQIRRFIRLTELVPEILQMVDDRQIAFRPAVEISYLTEEQQYTLLEAMSYNDATGSDNLVIYGHHIKGGKMFGALEDYKSQSFYEEHKTIQFDTLTQRGVYEIIAVFKTVAYSSQGFRYYDFVNAESEDEFNDYIQKCKELALYETGVTAEYGDRLITLSTCEYSAQNGRLVVVAKKTA